MPKKGRQATRTTPGFTGPFKGNAQQGTLFDVRTMPKTGEEIGPRGYSQNRSRQFQEAMEPVQRDVSTIQAERHPFGGSANPRYPLGYRSERGQSKIVDTLARSTAPPESVKGLKGISVRSQHPTRAGSYSGDRITLHETEGSRDTFYTDEPWTHADAPPGTKRPEQRGPEDPESEMTLLHELGHHASAQAKTQSSEYRTPRERGEEEGRADAFMLEHFRQDPRSAKWKTRIDPREHTYLARGGHPDPERFSVSPISEYQRALGAHNVKPQESHLNVMSGSGAATERHERPMLDEALPEHQQVFNTRIEGWSPRGGTPEEHREGVYNKAAQLTNTARFNAEEARGEGRTEVKRRWGVNRNLGRQW